MKDKVKNALLDLKERQGHAIALQVIKDAGAASLNAATDEQLLAMWNMLCRKYPQEDFPSLLQQRAPSYVGHETIPVKLTAPDILQRAAEHLNARAAERDQDNERSMARCVQAFNAIAGTTLSERDGWMFMAVLKATRACTTAKGHQDDYEDLAAYASLAGESAQ